MRNCKWAWRPIPMLGSNAASYRFMVWQAHPNTGKYQVIISFYFFLSIRVAYAFLGRSAMPSVVAITQEQNCWTVSLPVVGGGFAMHSPLRWVPLFKPLKGVPVLPSHSQFHVLPGWEAAASAGQSTNTFFRPKGGWCSMTAPSLQTYCSRWPLAGFAPSASSCPP